MVIYLIPGLGVDHRVFSKLSLEGHDVRYIRWLVPHPHEKLKDYAMRLAEQIDASVPFALVGFSFGGMCATEIAKVLKPEKLILISSAKGDDELPWNIKLMRFIPAHRYAPESWYRRMAWTLKWFYGIRGREQGRLFYEMIHSMPKGYRRWASNCIINWRNRDHVKTLHIHGDRDVVIPYRNIKNAVLVKGGTHFMLLNRAEEISRIIIEYLSQDNRSNPSSTQAA
jgi:pimeloyl-ACP methyl ester carboxylesterase